MSTATAKPVSTVLADNAGKYLTFELGRESYGVPVLKVREIIRVIDITRVPRMPDYVKGVINLRGKVMPVIDLRIRVGLEKAEFTDTTCTIVTQVTHSDGVQSLLGLIVDAVEEVSQVKGEELEPPPDFGSTVNTDYIVGMARIKGSIKTLLDIDKVIATEMSDAIDAVNAQQSK
jgi:purine-binding chemotaxis protein CheW